MSDTPHEALMQVVGEIWHELQKFDGDHKYLALEVQEIGGSAVVRTRLGFIDKDQKARMLVSKMFPFYDLPEILDTTMLLRELTEKVRK